MEYSKQKGLISDPEYNLMDLWHKFAMDKFGDKIKPDLISEFSKNLRISHNDTRE